MAWTGSATVKQINDRCCRVTGLSLAADASGVIGLADNETVGAVLLPASFKPGPTKYYGDAVSIADQIKVIMNITTDVTAPAPISIAKSGTTFADFALTFHNDLAGGGATSGVLELYIEFQEG